MNKWKLLAAGLGIFVLHAVASARDGHAAITIANPWVNDPMNVYIGMSGGVAKAVFTNRNTNACAFSILGNSGGLTNSFEFIGGSGSDVMVVVGGLGTRFDMCGTSVTSLMYQGHYVDIFGQGGSDYVLPGTGNSWGLGGEGDDVVAQYSPVGLVRGQNGNDVVIGTSSITTDRLFGEDGNDCLTDPGNAHADFHCGNNTGGGNDSFVSPASGAVSCEVPISSC